MKRDSSVSPLTASFSIWGDLMARFAASLTMLFNERPMMDRFAAARDAGFKGVEVLFPYDLPPRDLRKAAKKAGVEIVLMMTPPPNWAGGPRGFAAIPGGEERFRHDFARALQFTQILHARHLQIMGGRGEGRAAYTAMVNNLRWACDRAPHTSITIEPLNQIDMPGNFLSDFDLAAQIIEEVGRPNLGLQFDAYHCHQINGDVLATWHKYASLVRHIQIAGAPLRNEPQDSDIDYPAFFRAVDASGYSGWVAAEYTPRTNTAAGLRWLRAQQDG